MRMEVHVACSVSDNDVGIGVALVEELSGGFGGCFCALHSGRGEVAEGDKNGARCLGAAVRHHR